jgi:adenosyl cobinamide kinase/adenosyl cobinamide phosphate guanylyltransferase
MARADSEHHHEERKRGIQEKRAVYYATKAQAREEQARVREHEQRLKEWSKWRRGLSPRKQLARLKGGLKQLVGLSQR